MPGGRPSPIDQIIDHDDQGNPITVSERIIQEIRRGAFIEAAASTAGQNRQTVYEWLKVAARATLTANPQKLTRHEQRCIEFSYAFTKAEGDFEIAMNTRLHALSMGGIPQETVTEKRDPAGMLVERTVRTSRTLPDAKTIMVRLKQRFPDRYTERLQVTGADGGPVELSVEERAGALVSMIRNAREGRKESKQAKKEAAPKQALPVEDDVREALVAPRRRARPATVEARGGTLAARRKQANKTANKNGGPKPSEDEDDL